MKNISKKIILDIAIVCLINNTLFAERTFPEARGKVLDRDGQQIMLSPAGGYLMKKAGILEGEGKKGLQRYYNERFVSGTDLPTSVHANLQKSTENILDEMKVELNATEVLTMVMSSHTGEVFTIASSNRYDPRYIMQKDIPSLNPKFSEYLFEPGSVMKPITAALALDQNVMTIDTQFKMYDGMLQIGEGKYIRDASKLDDNSTLEDIIVNSSNVGISQVSWRLTGQEFREGLLSFGFAQKNGIDFPRDLPGMIKDEDKLEHKLHRANTAYGYGMMATFTQMLKAYSAFANEGVMVIPHIGTVETYTSQRAISLKTAKEMKKILVSVVENGTGKKAQIDGLIIGGKTGTAHIAKNGKYTDHYNSTFFGFAEDNTGHSFTIGVLVIEAKGKKKHFASQSAVPTFKKIVDVMVEEKLLVPETEKKNENIGIYIGEKTISPLPHGKLEKAFGTYIDKTYNLKVFNESITIQSLEKNAKVQNVLDGKVVFSGESEMLGKVVVMAHEEKIHTVYAGLSKISPTIAVGKLLKKGTVLGRVKDKLIFQVTQDSKHINPLNLVEL